MDETIIWKNIYLNEFQDYYMVSNCGQIKNIKSGKIISVHIRNGYQSVCLYSPQSKTKKTVNVHQIVANAFCEKNNQIINHKNGIKTDNNALNLEFVSYKYNTKHAIENKLHKPFIQKVCQYDKNDNFINEYNSITEAAVKLNISNKHISSVCKSSRKTAGGFKWKYSNSNKLNTIRFDHENCVIIKNYGNYKIDKLGNVYSMKMKKILKPKKHLSGYESVGLSDSGKKKDFYVHRLVAASFLEKNQLRKYVNHKNGIKNDNRLCNLEYCSASENTAHYMHTIKKTKKN